MRYLSIVGVLVLLAALPLLAATELEILTVSPQGKVGIPAATTDIVVTFAEPMVPLKATPEDLSTGPLQISPPLQGTYRWMGTRTLVFSATERLPLATEFKLKVPAGTRALSGAELVVDYNWSFETARPLLLYSSPENDEQGVDPKKSFLLRFNQAMDPRRLADKIRLTDNYKWIRLQPAPARQEDLTDRWRLGDDTTQVIRVMATTPLAKGTTYTLILSPGLLAAEGDLGLAEERRLNFVTYGPLKYKGFYSGSENTRGPLLPNAGIHISFNNRVAPSVLAKYLHFEPEVAIPEYYLERTWEQQDIYLDVEFKPETRYRFTIAAELTDKFGNKLGKAVRDSFTTAAYPSRMTLNTGPGVLEAYGDRRYPVFFVNKDKVKLRLGLIAPDRLIPLLNQEENLFSRSTPLPDSLFFVSRSWETAAPRNVKSAKPMEVDWLLAGRKTGLLLAELDDLSGDNDSRYQRILLQVTNLGVSAKFSPINNVIWVTQLKDALPVAGARVEIRDDQNRQLWSGLTDASGLAVSPGWRELGITSANRWERPRQWVIVYKDLDVAYTASDWGTGIYPYRFEIDYEWDPEPVKRAGCLFTDRGLYRAGETVQIKGMMREKKFSDWTVPADRDAVLLVRDGRGTPILNESMRLSDYGSFDYSLKLDAAAPLGYYDINLSAPPDSAGNEGESYLNGYFRLEAFRAAEFSVRLRPDRKEIVLGDSAIAWVNASFLFGAPMAGSKLNCSAFLDRGSFEPEGHPGYSFGPLYWDYSEESGFSGRTIAQRPAVLDAQGQYRFATSVTAQGVDFPLNLSLTAEVQGPNNQFLAANDRIVVHPAGFYIGVKPATTFIEAAKPVTIEVIATAADGSLLAGKKAAIQIVKRQWNSVRKAGVGGRYEWISKAVDTPVDSMVVTTASKPAVISYAFRQAGVHILRALGRDEAGRQTVSEIYFYITGKEYVAWQRQDDDRIELVPDARGYKPGDVARVMVKSPFESAEALVTLEREGIVSQQIMHLEGSTPLIQVPIKVEHLPNVFISVILLKGRSSNFIFSQEGEDIGRPAFKIGYANLPVDPGSQHLNVTVRTDREEYRPGEPVKISLEVKNAQGQPAAAEVTLAAVDKGILNLINYELPDPFDYFYGMRPLSVQTSETRLHVVEQRNYGQKGENRGGGGAENELMNLDVRKNFKSTAFWQPRLMVDGSGRAEVTFNLPDNLTTFKLMAVAQTLDAKFGRASSELKVNQPIMLLAALPRFARKGDLFEGGALVHNFSGQPGEGTLTVEAQGVELLDSDSSPFALKHGESKEIRFHFRARNPGTATFRFRCQMAGFSDGLERSIPIQAPTVKETVALYQKTEKDAAEKIQIPQNADRDLTNLEISLASTALSELSGSVEYLMFYPYECLEQRISRMLPIIIDTDLVEAFGLTVKGDRNYREIVVQGLKEMKKFQTEEGGLSLWPDGRPWPYISAYGAYAMTMAKQAGYEVDEDLLSGVLNYLRGTLTGEISREAYPYEKRSWLATDAFSLYVLSLNGQADAGYVERLYAERPNLPISARACLLKTIHLLNASDPRQAQLAQDFINAIRVSPTSAYFEEDCGDMFWIFHSNVRATAQALQAMMEAGADFPMAEQVVAWLMMQRKDGHWLNTQENFYVLHALSSYFARYEKVEPQFSAQVRLAGKEVFAQTFAGRLAKVERKVIPLDQFAPKLADVAIKKQGAGMLYYGLRMNYYPLEVADPREEGITVVKTMAPMKEGPAVDDVYQAGDLVKVILHVALTKERNYVVLEDPIPAGLEAVNTSFATTSAAVERAEEQAQDQQDWWYGFTHVERHDDRVLLFADWLPVGVHTYTYIARATTKGTFALPPTTAEEMYAPEVYGRTVSRKIRVE